MQREQQRTDLLPQPLGRLDCWCSPGSNSSAHFIIKGWGASRLFPATDVSYIRHKIMLTLCLTAPTLLVEQGFAGFLGGCPVQLREAPAAILHHAVPTQFRFRFAAIRWSDACRNTLFAGARTVQRLPGVSESRHRPPEKTPRRSVFGFAVSCPPEDASGSAIVGLPLGTRAKRGGGHSAEQVSGMAVLPHRAARPRQMARPGANSEFRRVS